VQLSAATFFGNVALRTKRLPTPGLGYQAKSRDICVFSSDKLISHCNKFSNIKITLHYSVFTRTSGEKVRISDEAERVKSVWYSHIRSLSGLYTEVCLREGKRGTCLGPPLQLWCVK